MLMRVMRIVLAVVCCIASTALVPARADVGDADIQAARDRLVAAQRDATAATERLNKADGDAAEAKAALESTQREIDAAQSRLDALVKVVRARAVEAYKNASNGSVSALGLALTEPEGVDSGRAARGQVYVRAVMSTDTESLAQMGALRDDLDAKRTTQASESARLTKAREEAAAAKGRLDTALQSAAAEKDRLEQQKASEDAARAAAAARALEEAAARQRADRSGGAGGGGDAVPGGGSGLACPVQGPVSFSNSWGAARSGGRQHKGVDMMAAEGTPEAAIVGGTISRTSDAERGLGGVTIWLQGDNGVSYYYAHNSRNAVHPGQRVSQGQIIGYVGRTGNARSTAAHLHFEVHPGGGGAINPYPTAASAC